MKFLFTFGLAFALFAAFVQGQVPVAPLVTAQTNSPDTNTVNLMATWNTVSNAQAFRLSEWIVYSATTNVFVTPLSAFTVTNLSETNAYGFCVAAQGTNGVLSSNSPTVFWSQTPNHFQAIFITQTNGLGATPFVDYFTNLTETNFNGLMRGYRVRVASSNWFWPTN